MVTAGLEKLILCGKAKYKTVSIGGSGVGTIICPPTAQFIVLVDIIWNGFNDVPNFESETNYDNLTGKQIHTLRLRNGKEDIIYNFRDSFVRGGASSVPFFGPAQQYTSYILAKQHIQVDVFKFGAPKLTTWITDTIPLTSNEPAQPNGYGGQPTIRSIRTGNGAEISSMGLPIDPGGVLYGPRTRNEFYDDITTPAPVGDDNKLSSPTLSGSSYGFPLVTFGVVEVNEVPDDFLR